MKNDADVKAKRNKRSGGGLGGGGLLNRQNLLSVTTFICQRQFLR